MTDKKETVDSIEEDGDQDQPVIPEAEQAALKALVLDQASTVPSQPPADVVNAQPPIPTIESNHETKESLPYRVARLDDLCLSFIASNFNSYPILDEIPEQYVDTVVANIDLSQLLINQAAEKVTCSALWQRMARERWQNCVIKAHGNSWKRLYLEKHVCELVESYYPSTIDPSINMNRLLESLDSAAPFVEAIKLDQLPSHLDLSQILPKFKSLMSLDVTYRTMNVGMNYKPEDSGMSLSDALNLSKYVQTTATLRTLVLSECLLDDEILHILMGGMQRNKTITNLDLSCNRISNVGARRISTFLSQKDTVLQYLNLNNNLIEDQGLQYISSALLTSCNASLTQFDISHNCLNDEGVIDLFENVGKSSTALETLNVSCNNITHASFDALLSMLKMNKSLMNLDVSGNPWFGLLNSRRSSAASSVSQSKANSRPASSRPASSGASVRLTTAQNEEDEKSSSVYAKLLENCLLKDNSTVEHLNLAHTGLSKLEMKTVNQILKPRKIKKNKMIRKQKEAQATEQ